MVEGRWGLGGVLWVGAGEWVKCGRGVERPEGGGWLWGEG